MKHLGDITLINGAEIEPVDVIVGGSPCQDLSVAGKRAGLDGERSGLFMEQIRIIKEMRLHSGATYPRFMVWENVPGAFSSNQAEDFRIVLEETAKIADETAVIPRPNKGKWTNAGAIMGDRWSIAWRVFDAQFWGVPQRRRRIALVADFGGQSAPEILFKSDSLSGNFAQGRTQGEETATDAERSTNGAVFYRGGGFSNYHEDDIAATQRACISKQTDVDLVLYEPKSAFEENWAQSDVKNALRAEASKSSHVICMATQQGGAEIRTDDMTPTLTAAAGMSGNNQPVVAYCIGNGQADAAGHITEDVCQTLNCMHDQMAIMVAAVDCRNLSEDPDINGTLQAKSNGGTSLNLNNIVRCKYIVRRLTPLECERLQGYPDGWTDIGDYIDSNGKHKHSSDSARYKALGNSIALPPWRFVLSGIYGQGVKTMGSLFDGIGGFSLIWQELGGQTLWASEIEEFPIAVTKLRLGGTL